MDAFEFANWLIAATRV